MDGEETEREAIDRIDFMLSALYEIVQQVVDQVRVIQAKLDTVTWTDENGEML